MFDIPIDIDTQKALKSVADFAKKVKDAVGGLKNVGKDVFKKVVDDAKKATKKIEDGFDNLQKKIVAIYAVSEAVDFVGGFVEAFNTQEQAVAKVTNAYKTMNGVGGKTLQELIDKASELQNNSLFGDEEILDKATATLITFGNVQGKVFDEAQQAALDMAAFMKKDLKEASTQVGKALNDPIKGMASLADAGVQFTAAQQKSIKTMQAAGDMAGAQKIVLGELQMQFGGTAKVISETGTGPMTQIQNQFADLAETVGAGLMPVLRIFAQLFGWIAIVLGSNTEILQDIITVLAIFGTGILLVVGATKLWTIAQAALNFVMALNPISLIILGIGLLISIIVVVANKFTGWSKAMKAIFAIMKLEFLIWKDALVLAFKLIGKDFEIFVERVIWIKDAVIGIFSGIGTAVKKILAGDFSGLGDAFTDAMPNTDAIDALKTESQDLIDIQNDLTESRRADQQLLARDVRLKKVEKEEVTVDPNKKAAFKLPPVTVPLKTKSASGEGVKAGRSSAKKSVLNIENVVKEMTITQSENPLKIKSLIEKALLTLLADTNQQI